MRLWHKDLIPVLPRQQLVSQWRECCCIAKNIAENGTPNHILVNDILFYKASDFIEYTSLVLNEMKKRGYKISTQSFAKFCNNMTKSEKYFEGSDGFDNCFMNNRYLKQCFYNLQEKYDRHGISFKEWDKVEQFISDEKPSIKS